MSFIGTAKVSTDALGQLVSRKQAIGLDHIALGVDPFGLNWVEPGTLSGQQEGQDPHAFARLLDWLVVFPDPAPHLFADMPGGVIPDQQPTGLALLCQASTAPLQKLGRDVTDGAPRHKAQPDLV